MSSKLLRLKAENWMKLEAVSFEFDGENYVEVTGGTGAGKSCAFAAFHALLGGKDAIPADPVRHGAEYAKLQAVFDTFEVSRRVNPDRTTTLSITTKEGMRPASSQKFLDGLKSSLGFDPVAFARMDAKAKRDQLAELIGLKGTLDELAQHDKADYEERTVVNRELKQVAARLAAMPEVEATEPVAVADLLADLRMSREHNRAADAQRETRERYVRDAAELRATAARKREQAEKLLAEAQDDDATAALADRAAEGCHVPASIELSPLEQRLEQSESINARARAFAERQQVEEQAKALQAESDALTASLKHREAERAKVLAAAEFPVPGLSLSEDGVIYNGVTFEQASRGEEMLVSASIGMRLNPGARIMLVNDAILMDPPTRKVLAQMAADHDFLVLAEVTDVSGKTGIYIENGRVVAVDGVPTTEPTAVPAEPTPKRRRTAAGV